MVRRFGACMGDTAQVQEAAALKRVCSLLSEDGIVRTWLMSRSLTDGVLHKSCSVLLLIGFKQAKVNL